MTDSNDTFSAPDGSGPVWVSVEDQLENLAFEIAESFFDLGAGTQEATSIAAHAFIRAAWKVAGSGRVAAGEVPDPERFLKACQSATSDISWEDKPKNGEETT